LSSHFSPLLQGIIRQMQSDSKIEEVFRLSPPQKKALKKLGLETVEDLLFHLPARHIEQSERKNISDLEKGDKVEIFGKIEKIKTSKAYRKKIPMAEGVIEDSTGKIKAVWFHQAYIAKMYPKDTLVRAEGKVSERRSNNELYMTNPELEKIAKIPKDVGQPLFNEDEIELSTMIPIYPESRGVTSRWFFHSIQKVLQNNILESLEDPIPERILKKYNLPKLKTALVWIHRPKKQDDSESARKRFAFQEIFLIQIERQKERKSYESKPSFKIERDKKRDRGVC